jgi:hypothetical protein
MCRQTEGPLWLNTEMPAPYTAGPISFAQWPEARPMELNVGMLSVGD